MAQYKNMYWTSSTGSIFRLIRTPQVLEWLSQKWNEGLCESMNGKRIETFSAVGKSEVLKVASQFIYMQNNRNSQQLVFVQPHKR